MEPGQILPGRFRPSDQSQPVQTVEELLIGLTDALEETRGELEKLRAEKRKNGNGNGRTNFWIGLLGAILAAAIIGAGAQMIDHGNRLTAIETGCIVSDAHYQDHEARIRILERGGGIEP